MSQLATQNKREIRDYIQSTAVREQLAMALPKYLTADRMARICITSINRTPKLLECSPESLLGAIMLAAQMGIEPDGRNGHLIPYGNQVQFIPDYRGLVGLVRKNDNVADVYADLVRDKDVFSIRKGLHRDLIHEIDIRADRGKIVGAYAVLQYKDGTQSFEFMSKQEIDDIRSRSKSSGSGPWVTDYGEMAKKTVIKRLLKLADLSPDTADRIALDVESEVIPQEQPRLSKPAFDASTPEPQSQLENGSASEPEPEQPKKREMTLKTPRKEKLPEKIVAQPLLEVPGEAPPAARLAALLASHSFSNSDLLSFFIREKWFIPSPDQDVSKLSLEDLSDDQITMALDNFTEAVLPELEKTRASAA